jgi:protein-disulfide isomerase
MASADADAAAPSRLTLAVGARDHGRGPERAPLTLLEYGDFECPQCRQAYPIVKELERRFGDRLRFVFRHFPLTNVHPSAQPAAEAAEWAAAQGLFWQMHDAIYEDGERLSKARLLDLGARLPASSASLEQAWRAHSFFPRVKEDFLSGIESGVTGTPGFFINDVRHDGGWDVDSLGRALEAAAAAPDDHRSG